MNVRHKRLLELLNYDKPTGVFTWRVARNGHVRAGDRAGNENKSRPDQPYRQIMIGLRNYRSGRLAWFYVTGRWPKKEIDHINGNPLDDAWGNLRLATSSQNKVNQKLRRDNKTGFKGVHKHGQRWYARAHIRGVYRHLGMFDTAEEASETYKKVTLAVHGEYANRGL
jgi:HNH endonuclease